MNNEFEKICQTPAETKDLAQKFAQYAKEKGAFVSLFGELGSGKTVFVKFAADALGVQEKITSPSFVILNEYHSGELPVYHFDLYRLEQEGVNTIIDELREYSEGKMLTFVEWAEFSQDEVPFNHLQIKVTYGNDDARKYSFKAFGEDNIKLIERLKNEYTNL